MKLSILITLLNEELVLSQTHEAMSAQLEQMLGKELSDYELLYTMMAVVTKPMN